MVKAAPAIRTETDDLAVEHGAVGASRMCKSLLRGTASSSPATATRSAVYLQPFAISAAFHLFPGCGSVINHRLL